MKTKTTFHAALSVLLVAIIGFVSLNSSAFAIDTNDISSPAITDPYVMQYMERHSALSLQEYVEAAQYAYMDITAFPEMADTILSARSKIIWSESWTVAPTKAWRETASGERYELPDFYSLFPSDWDIPGSSKKDANSSAVTTDKRVA